MQICSKMFSFKKGFLKGKQKLWKWLRKGLSNKEVSNQLFVTEKPISFTGTNIYKKMSLESRAQPYCVVPYASLAQLKDKNASRLQILHHSGQDLLVHQGSIPRGSSTITSNNNSAPDYLNRTQ